MFTILEVMFLVCASWLYVFFGVDAPRARPEIPKIPQAYWDTETKGLYVTEEPLRGYPPYAHPDSEKKTLWEAWTCTNHGCATVDKGKPPIFPRVVKLPAGVIPPKDGDEPSMEFEQAYMEAEMTMPVCPHCKKEEYSTRYMTP
ncbi:MAG: hypothetical protein ACYTGH_15240, partial [Planctomycetota bacterium]